MNRKGFAISALIYGLSIMGILLMAILIGVMSVNRSNNRKLSTSIEEDLNRFSKTETTFSPSESDISGGQEYSVPAYEAGWYRIELMGAAGNGGYGAYTSGVIELKDSDKLYFTIGKRTSGKGENTKLEILTGDGRKTIMVAAGGGKASGTAGGTLMGYKESSKGGTINISENPKNYKLTSLNLIGYDKDNVTNQNYKVREAVDSSDNTGGVSYIAGYAGCVGLPDDGHSGIEAKDTIAEDAEVLVSNKREYYFVDGLMIPGVNNKESGWAKVERVVKKNSENQTLIRKNENLNGVNKIEDCVDNESPLATQIIAISKGKIVPTSSLATTTGRCKGVTITGGVTDIDEIAVWHGKNGVDIKSIIKTNKGTIKGNAQAITETPTGFRISAYQYDSTKRLPNKGNYYIMPVLSENKVITAAKSLSEKDNDIKIEYIQGLQRQKWSVEKLTNPKVKPASDEYEYKIVELARFKALAIKNDSNIERETLFATEGFNEYSRNDPQIWVIKEVGDGTYTITTPIAGHNKDRDTGNLVPDQNEKIIIGLKNITTTRFRLISVDYSG